MIRRFLTPALAGLGLLVIILIAYVMSARPYQLHWGATQEEITRSMPGDELDAHPSFLATRAITIKGTPQEIWPWLVQMGYDRAGYYGYDILENIGMVSRIRWSHHWSQPSLIAPDLFTEFTDHLAVRKILQGVSGRVEGLIEPPAWTNTEFAIYVTGALTFALAVILNTIRPFSRRRWLAGLGAGAVWLVTWYAPIPTWMGPALLVCAIYGLWRTRLTVTARRPQ